MCSLNYFKALLIVLTLESYATAQITRRPPDIANGIKYPDVRPYHEAAINVQKVRNLAAQTEALKVATEAQRLKNEALQAEVEAKRLRNKQENGSQAQPARSRGLFSVVNDLLEGINKPAAPDAQDSTENQPIVQQLSPETLRLMTWGKINGRAWKAFPESAKVMYVIGASDAFRKEAPNVLAKKFPLHLNYAEVSVCLDQFYLAPENLLIPAIDALRIVTMKANGETQSLIDTETAEQRALANMAPERN